MLLYRNIFPCKNVQVVIQVVNNKKVMAKTPREANLYANWCVRKGLTLSRAGFFGAPVGRGGGAQSAPLVKTLFPFSESTQVKFF